MNQIDRPDRANPDDRTLLIRATELYTAIPKGLAVSSEMFSL
jgi:hypothetical protein